VAYKGLINSRKRMKISNNLKRKFTLMREDLECIKNIKKCIKEYYRKPKKKRETMSYRHQTKLKPRGS